MSVDMGAIHTALHDWAKRLGCYENVTQHEPKNPPGQGLTLAIFAGVGGRQPIQTRSGLDVTSYRFEFTARAYCDMMKEPQERVESDMFAASDLLIDALSDGFTLGGLVTAVDLLGAWGAPLGFTPGYIQQDTKLYRVFDHLIPLIIDDTSPQGA